ncbi:MAG TPA: methionyl-tRNA formyltransferase [Candidatus Paceibacterota bacterium]
MSDMYTFFGTGTIARIALEELDRRGSPPTLVVTAPDRAQGRGLASAPSPVGAWAQEHGVEVLKPAQFDESFLAHLKSRAHPLFVVADYGAILPKALLDIPARGALNIHPSLLPRLRGPSPIRSAILTDEKDTGITVILLDEAMDHGPIVAQRKVPIREWPPRGTSLDELLAREGGRLLADIIPLWMRGEIEPRAQNHDVATYCTKFKKEDGEIDLSGDAYSNLLKIRAFEGWPTAYTFLIKGDKKIRVKILDAHLENRALVLDRVIPEGKREMSFAEFLGTTSSALK